MNEKALERARRGAAWLDKKLGPSWRRKIRRTRLDMGRGRFRADSPDSCGCILAQLYRDYSDGAEALGIEPFGPYSERLGLTNSPTVPYRDLNEAWRQVLREGVTA